MSELLHQLGINWKLLAAQAVNFGLLLIILRLTVYKPLLTILRERRERIEQGVKDAAEARHELEAADSVMREKIAEGEKQSLAILKETEEKSKGLEATLLEGAHKKEHDILLAAEKQAKANEETGRKKFYEEAATLVRQAIVKTVEADPKSIDEALIKQAVAELTH
jgi:F-type H+-transporting ATPase subunit b